MPDPDQEAPPREAGRAPLERMERILRPPFGRWSDTELLELPRLYRHGCTRLARAADEDPHRTLRWRELVRAAHGLLFRPRDRELRSLPARAAELLLVATPRALRAEWKLLALTCALVYGLAALAWVSVARDLDLAFSLLDPAMIEQEIEQLEKLAAGESFRGNFTFGLGASPLTAGWIVLHNIGIGILFFASALFPPFYFYVLVTNALMLGAYTGVAGHWGQASAISSILWTHGVLEIQAVILAGTAGLVLVRAWIRPGAYTRRHALVRESRRALTLFAPVFPLLVVAGLIEGFVSPHAPLAVRLVVAVASGLALVAWVGLGGRAKSGRFTSSATWAPLG